MIVLVLGIVVLVLAIVAFFNLVGLSINYLNIEGLAWDWFNTGNFWAWFWGTIAFILLTGLARFLIGLVRGLVVAIFMAIRTPFERGRRNATGKKLTFLRNTSYGLLIAAALTVVSVAVASTIFLMVQVIQYTTAHPEASDFYVEGNWFGYIALFCYFIGVFLPSQDKE